MTMSRVFNKVASGFRLSVGKCSSTSISRASVSTLSDSSLKWKPAAVTMTLLQQSSSLTKPFGRFLNKNCGCVGGFARFSTNARLNSTPKTAPLTTPAQKEEENRSSRPEGGVSDLEKPKELKSGQVFKHARHNMYVCWHPEVPFPYEMTKPIDLNAPVTDSHLKIQSLVPVKEAFRKKHHKLTIQELIKLTYSTKHRFYGPFGKKKRLVLRDMDPNKEKRNREYL